ncbi:probable flap endonuclease 1 homolog isoform X2 [Astatotilapia calliptera]|uniref:probable flap endonuclease 1 homolog isoform X2 n=1 Tax=Astatotilapia calliptera TaxID=8154 RepID=UPI000E42257F|nr:probable flap endonuclease 1 homolog isoform X2 [Astatotilapia calliptera]
MGITKLADLIRSDAPDAISYKDISDYTGKVIALDTSIVVNQFRAVMPTLSPLTGLFFRTLTFLEHGIKPVFVFDGKPPGEKKAVLEKRAQTAGRNYSNWTGTASLQTKECLQLLKYLGVPVIQAPGDAEALCAQLVREGTVHAVASEDMDTLPFGANILIRQLNAKKDSEVIEYSLPKLLEKLQIGHKEIPGLGPKRALTLIQKHRTIEDVVLHINRKTHPVPNMWKYREARKIFLDGPQSSAPELIWTEPNEEALVEFLCHTKRIKEERIRNRMVKFRMMRENKREEREKEKAEGGGKQTCIKDFFRVTRKRVQPVDNASSPPSNRKRPKSK